MYTWETLVLTGYNDRTIPNTFIKQKTPASVAALVLPGWGYTAQMPLLFYTTEILLNKGVDVLQVDYAYNTLPEFATLDAESRNQWLFTDVAAAYRALCEQRTYEHIVLVGKSLGTLGVGHLLAMQTTDTNVSAIWMTPLVKHPKLRAQIKNFAGSALIVIGTDDQHYDAACLEEIGEAGTRKILAIEGANHGMNIPDDVPASIQVLEQIMRGVEIFVNGIV